MKVLYKATNPVLLRTSSIGYLYEIAKVHPTILLVGKNDPETDKILRDKRLFPKLEKIIFADEPFYGQVLKKHFRLYKTIKEAVKTYRPDIVISTDDTWPGSMYLMRLGKRLGALALVLQDGFQIAEGKKLYLWSCLTNAHLRMPRFFPFALRMLLVKLKKYLGHFFYYWILPLTVLEKPFLGKTSFVFWNVSSGLRADYAAVFSRREYDLHVKDGIAPEKILVLGHPLAHKNTKEFLERAYFLQNYETTFKKKVLTIFWSSQQIAFDRNNYSLIPESEILKTQKRIIQLISEQLSGWQIFIKPKADFKNALEVRNFLGSIPGNVSIVEPTEPADKYIKMSQVIVGVPPPSTTLLTAFLQSPEKIILSLDFSREFLGDAYRNFDGIEYIDNEKDLEEVLMLIAEGKYSKKNTALPKFDFSSASEMLDYIYDKSGKVLKYEA